MKVIVEGVIDGMLTTMGEVSVGRSRSLFGPTRELQKRTSKRSGSKETSPFWHNLVSMCLQRTQCFIWPILNGWVCWFMMIAIELENSELKFPSR